MFQDNEKIVRITRQVFFFQTVLPIISLGSDVKKRRRLRSFGPIFFQFFRQLVKVLVLDFFDWSLDESFFCHCMSSNDLREIPYDFPG